MRRCRSAPTNTTAGHIPVCSTQTNNTRVKMLCRIFFVCLSLGVFSAASPLSCRWITGGKFRQHSEKYLELLETMANNSTNSTEDAEDAVSFPDRLYSQASTASAEDKLAFLVQILNETAVLLEEDHSSASWEEKTVEDFLQVVTQQADQLLLCIGSHGQKENKKLHMYFQRLRSHVLQSKGHSAEAWELIRKEIKSHLMRGNQLVASLLNTN